MRVLLTGLIISTIMAGSFFAVADSAKAQEKPVITATALSNCTYQEQVTLTVIINGHEKGAKQAKALLDKRINDVDVFAKQMNAKITLNSLTYNINPQPQYNGIVSGPEEFQISGSINYQLENADMAIGFVEMLLKQNIESSINVNASPNQSCTPAIIAK